MTKDTMTERCPRGFDETLVSGYLDGVLTQADRQRVALHLEDCPSCRSLFDSLLEVRSAARSTSFVVPSDDQWRETPRTAVSAWSRRGGWWLLLLWLAVVAGVSMLVYAQSAEPWWEKLAVFGGLAAGGILLLSVLLDRLHDLKTDRYRGVHK